jgi:hypothetical protein
MGKTGKLRDGPGQGIEVQGLEESPGVVLLVGPEAGIDLGYVDGTASQGVSLFQEFPEKLAAAAPVVDGVDDDAGVKEEGGHASGRLLS